MQYKCQNCEDTGHSNPDVFDLDCTDCDVASQRYALNKFASDARRKSPDVGDLYWAIHQRALAMAPKQEAPACSECDGRGFTYWGEGNPGNGFDVAPEPPEQECCQVCGGSGNAPPDSELVVSAPAAANGAMPELPKPETMIVESDLGHRAYSADQMRTYGQACALAATDPNAALVKTMEEFIVADWPACNPGCDYEDPYGGMHDHRSKGCTCEAAKESIERQRAALSGAKGN